MSDNITKEEFLALDTEEKNTKQKNTEEKNTISKEEFLSLEKTEGSQTTDVTAEPQTVSTDTESTSEDGSSESQQDDKIYESFIPEVKIVSPKDEKFNPFGFFNFENKEEFDKNTKEFFNQKEEPAVKQLKSILGDEYIIKKSGVTLKDFFSPKGKSKNLDQVKIRHKDADKKDFIKIDFAIGDQQGGKEVVQNMYDNSVKTLFDYVNRTMSIESVTKSQTQQGKILQQYNKLNAPAIKDLEGNITQEAGPLHVSDEVKDNINEEVSNLDFTPITKQVNISTDPKYPQMVDRTEQPYKDELKQAKFQLINSGIENPSKEQIEKSARTIIEQNRIQKIYDQKASDYMNSDEVEETDLDALLKLGGFLNKKINF